MQFPLGLLVAVTGVSGAGKSTLVSDILQPELARRLHGAKAPSGQHDEILGVDGIDKVMLVDQSYVLAGTRRDVGTRGVVFAANAT